MELVLWFSRFFTCVSWGILPSTNLVDRPDYSFTSLRFFFLLFSYVSLSKNLDIWSLCSLSCPSFYSFLLLFTLHVLFSPSLFINFIFWSPLLFSFQICYPFFSFLFSYYSILSACPSCSITIQSILFLLELSS